MGIIKAIQKSNFPQTHVIDIVSSVMSFLALKLLGNQRLSHDQTWNLDRAPGLFAGLNVLPKNATLSSYSYRVLRCQNRDFLIQLNRIFKDDELEQGKFNLDFKTIPHWGDESILEKNWSGSRSKVIKSLLALIVQDPDTGLISYTNAEIKHKNQDDTVLEFVDSWKEGRGICPKMLIFDSKFTTYHHLSELNRSQIKFLTIRRRGKKLKEKAWAIPNSEWIELRVKAGRGKHKTIKVNESRVKLRNYQGEVRQFIITNHSRPQPTFMITNDFDSPIGTLIRKYARRWLVEQEIAEQVQFFHLNQPSSSIVVKV
ncbi:MAG: transposase, partial [Candidatus Aminicenantes bacterium]|nr:transposase [Candidatus Aminicenantes bacterium]